MRCVRFLLGALRVAAEPWSDERDRPDWGPKCGSLVAILRRVRGMAGQAVSRATSKQDYATPRGFIEAVSRRFGRIEWDLAATSENHKASPEAVEQHGTPWYTPEEDALAVGADWAFTGAIWLNPPFRDIEPWAAKAAKTLAQVRADPKRRNRHDFRLCMLTPASIGSNWYADHVHGRALVLALSPRLTFVGETQPYPKDLILSVFGLRPGFDVWRYK